MPAVMRARLRHVAAVAVAAGTSVDIVVDKLAALVERQRNEQEALVVADSRGLQPHEGSQPGDNMVTAGESRHVQEVI